MKPEIHPEYGPAKVQCACGAQWETRSTQAEIHTEICSSCHPFYTGSQQTMVMKAGQVERFKRRYGKHGASS
jgi:large subunit ribosomal protein L31